MPLGAKESLVVGVKMSLQLVLGRMFGAVGVFVRRVSETPQRFSTVILLCAALMAFMLRRRYILRKKEEAARRFAAQLEGHQGLARQVRLTQAREACGAPPEEASPLKLQTLCVVVLYRNITRFDSLLEDFHKKAQKPGLRERPFHGAMGGRLGAQTPLFKASPSSPRAQAAETKDILGASRKKAKLAEKEILEDLVKIAHPQENTQLFAQEAAKGPEGAREAREQQPPACVKIQVPE